ncbi:hypothetical protein [Aurantiacibacter zhengii]|uniref:Uncharacterized protein n=1 Tax=Aurantiacibacter zhengii TaxID=2307003 RepID=A0A418NRA9_9SPHN|nr:hypothetical protein [Aurantiacibacter zhengii]RIV85132.1 hypothetical protein D2V07_12685 [Aurantiacibacter zhengii]
MIFVRGIKGDLKLNPTLKFWGILFLVVAAIVWMFKERADSLQEKVAKCEERGGAWVGGALQMAFCETDEKDEKDW